MSEGALHDIERDASGQHLRADRVPERGADVLASLRRSASLSSSIASSSCPSAHCVSPRAPRTEYPQRLAIRPSSAGSPIFSRTRGVGGTTSGAISSSPAVAAHNPPCDRASARNASTHASLTATQRQTVMTEKQDLRSRLVVGRKRDGAREFDENTIRELVEFCLTPAVSIARATMTLIRTGCALFLPSRKGSVFPNF
ncbi:hypothetical protein [Burkholderia diffusa]|uniref:hypothetical protein n=1 Tax=Burkholderia diffusa TaxID=488732 RepID=UPI001E3B9309|nr:hypothetical protein [Burkholderia diffusa]